MTYALAAVLAAVGAALMVFVAPLRVPALLLFAVSGFVLRDTGPGTLVRQGVSTATRVLTESGGGRFAPWVGLVLAVVVGAALVDAVLHRRAGLGAGLLAFVFPTLLILSGSSPVADGILHGLGWLTSHISSAVTAGPR